MTYHEFWPHYLAAHTKPKTRFLHFIGTTLAIVCIGLAVALQNWWLMILAPIFGYGFSSVSHFTVEKNKPAAFGKPLWSLYSDFRMFFLWCSGHLAPELAKFRINPNN
jgi:hypothetical protein